VSIALSLIIPAYDEAERLPRFLQDARRYLVDRYPSGHEVIVVDDGSADDTADVVEVLSKQWPQLSCIVHARNQGKGAAVRTGMLAADGEVLLFADADGATPIAEERHLRSAIDAGAHVAVGSRTLSAEGVVRRRSLRRAATGRMFARFARWIVPVPVRDTQCGFKMFRRDVARRLFLMSQEQGYLFDLEVLALANRLGYWIAEVPISWTEIPGSKLHLRRVWKSVWSGLWRLRRRLESLGGEETDV
jgi:dolichyl-phosphate beta-glucosyltransferase